jgi:hypothetical protein
MRTEVRVPEEEIFCYLNEDKTPIVPECGFCANPERFGVNSQDNKVEIQTTPDRENLG